MEEITEALKPLINTALDPKKEFEVIETLGAGTYGTVYKGLHRESGKIVAIKVMPLNNNIETIKKEILVLKKCQHINIVGYYGAFLKDEDLWLIMEYCSAGSVKDIIMATKSPLKEEHIAVILKEVIKGLEYIHDHKLIHRDIKAGNILLSNEGRAKIADFGVVATLVTTMSKTSTKIGSPFWMSPEVIISSEYNKKADIWSLGITAIEMAEGVPPYSHMNQYRAMFVIQTKPPRGLTQPERWSSDFNNFIKKCLSLDPKNRPTCKELLLDPFIMSAKSRAVISELVANSMASIENYRTTKSKQNDSILDDEDNKEDTNQKNQEPQNDNDEEPVESGSLVRKNSSDSVIINNNEEEKEPEFMKHIKNMDLDHVASGYAINHFQEKKAHEIASASKEKDEIPSEFVGLKIENLKGILVNLQNDMNAEIEVIKQRYGKRIEVVKRAIDMRIEDEMGCPNLNTMESSHNTEVKFMQCKLMNKNN